MEPCVHVCASVSVRLHVLKSSRLLLSSDPNQPLRAQRIHDSLLQRCDRACLVCPGCCNTTTSAVVTPLWAADRQQMSISHCPRGWKSKLRAPGQFGVC